MTFKRNAAFFLIGILVSVFGFSLEFIITNELDENQDRDLISFVSDYLEGKYELFLIIFLIAFPVGLFSLINPKLIYFNDATIFVTGYAWFGVLMMLIDYIIGAS